MSEAASVTTRHAAAVFLLLYCSLPKREAKPLSNCPFDILSLKGNEIHGPTTIPRAVTQSLSPVLLFALTPNQANVCVLPSSIVVLFGSKGKIVLVSPGLLVVSESPNSNPKSPFVNV